MIEDSILGEGGEEEGLCFLIFFKLQMNCVVEDFFGDLNCGPPHMEDQSNRNISQQCQPPKTCALAGLGNLKRLS